MTGVVYMVYNKKANLFLVLIITMLILILAFLLPLVLSGCVSEQPDVGEEEINETEDGVNETEGVEEQATTEERPIYNLNNSRIFLDHFEIVFNGEQEGDLVATTVLNRTREQSQENNYEIN